MKRTINIIFKRNLLVLTITALMISCAEEVKLNPGAGSLEEYTGFLKIPGVGFQTFFRFEDEDPSLKEMPFESGSAYFRWMWEQVEPQ